MITWVEHNQINKAKWDLCIQQSVNESIFVYSWYLDAVCDNWCALILNDYEAVFPLAEKSKFGICYLYQPIFVRYFGIYAASSLTEKMETAFFESVFSRYKNLNFNLHESTIPTSQIASSVLQTTKQFQYLEMTSDYKQLYENYSKNVKRNLTRAAKEDYRITNQIAPSEIVELFKKTKGAELSAFKSYHYQHLLLLINACLSKKGGETSAVYQGDNLMASAFFMQINNRFTYLNGSVTEEGKKNGAMHFLIDHFIQKNAGKQNILDFGGSSVESVARFYKSFGAKDCVYLQLERGILYKLAKWIKF